MLKSNLKRVEDSDNVEDEADKVMNRMKQDEFNFSIERTYVDLPML